MTPTRRRFLAAGGLGSLATLGLPKPAFARDLTPAEKANVKVVSDFSAAWATGDAGKVASFLSDDCVVRFTQTQAAVKGRAIVEQQLKAGLSGSKVEFEVLETFAAGELVANLRNDYITSKAGKQKIPVAGVFYVRNGKIVEWIDSIVA
jgi:limonene-1,2-epoxide hydrolase